MLDGRADLVVARRRRPTRDAWPLHARLANRELARRVRRRTGLAAAPTSARCGLPRREPLLGLGVADRAQRLSRSRRSSGPPTPAGGSSRPTSPTCRGWAGRRSPARCAARWARSATCQPGARDDVTRPRHVIVLAKQPVPGRVQDPADARRSTRAGRPGGGRALADTLAAVGRGAGHCWTPAGFRRRPGGWLPTGWRGPASRTAVWTPAGRRVRAAGGRPARAGRHGHPAAATGPARRRSTRPATTPASGLAT